MRVLLVADTVGGVRTFVRELARELTERGVELQLALLGPDPGFDELDYEVRDLRLEWMEDAWDDVAAAGDWVRRLCERHRPDLVHMNTFTPVHDPDVPVLLTVHSCVETWWRAVHGRPAPSEWEAYRQLVRRSLERASLLVAPTDALLAEFSAAYGRLPRARVIPNGRRAVTIAAIRRERLVVTAGRLWDAAKNVALVARAAPAIQGRVIALGTGSVAGVECRGPVNEDDVIAWLSRASVFVEPARYEPFGLAALEAARCGCALVLGDIPSLREVWGDAAVFVSPDDHRSLAREVNALLADRGRLRARAEAAARRAQSYSPPAMAVSYHDAYASVAGVPA